MEGIQSTLKQIGVLWQSFSPSQKGTYTMIVLLLLAAPLIYSYKGGGSAYVSLLPGGTLKPHQLKSVEFALYNTGLSGWRREGMDIVVPQGREEEFAKALAAQGALPPDISDIVLDELKEESIFSLGATRTSKIDEGRKKQIAEQILEIDDVQEALVNWAPPERRSFGPKPARTGSVMVRMVGGRDFSSIEERSIQTIVAHSVGLRLQDVTVTNLATGYTSNAKDNDSNDIYFRRRYEEENELRRKIEDSLRYIPDVVVTVSVELEKLEQTKSRHVKYDPKAIVIEKSTHGRSESVQENQRRSEPGSEANKPYQVRGDAKATTQRDFESEKAEQKSIVSGEESIGVTQGLRVVSSSATVTIPESFYQDLLEQEGVTKPATDAPDQEKGDYRAKILAKENEIKPKVTAAVTRLIKVPDGVEPETLVSIVSPPSLAEKPIEGPGMLDEAGGLLKSYGRSAGLALFALAALFLLNRSLKGAAPAPEPDIAAILNPPQPEEPSEPVREPEPLPPSRRDDVQFLVKDNPEMAAAVLNKWLSN